MKLITEYDINNIPFNFLSIKESIPFTSTFSKCMFQVISLDLNSQITFGETYFKEAVLNVTDYFSVSLTLFNSFPCFSSFQPNPGLLKLLTNRYISILINSSSISTKKFAEEIDFNVSFFIRRCQRGELYDMQLVKCVNCQANFYSFETEFVEPSSCKSCFHEPFNCYGGFNLTPKAGYWRNSEFSQNFMKCPYPLSCIGDPLLNGMENQLTILYEDFIYAQPKGVCLIGHEGVLCSKCSKGYAKIGNESCAKCKGGLSIFLILFKILFRILIFFYTIYKALVMCWDLKKNRLSVGLVYSNFMLKIMMLHLQFLKSFLGFPFKFPDILRDLFNLLSFSISSGVDKALNLECFLSFNNFPISYFYTIINIISPLIVVGIISIFIRERDKFERGKVEQLSDASISSSFEMKIFFKYSVIQTNLTALPFFFIIGLMLSYGQNLELLLNNISAINIDDNSHPDYRLVDNFTIDFYSSQHLKWISYFVLPLIVIIGILIPGYIIFKISQSKRTEALRDKENLFRFGYFFFAYSEEATLYELTYFFRKIFLAMMDTFFIKVLLISKTYDPLTFLITICFFYTWLSFILHRKNPYNQQLYPKLNNMEKLSVNIQALSAWVGCFLLSLDINSDYSSKNVVNIIGFLLGFFMNSVMFITWSYFYWKLSWSEKFNIVIKYLKQKIVKKVKTKNTPQNQSVVKVFLDQAYPISKFDDEKQCIDINEEEKGDILFHDTKIPKSLPEKSSPDLFDDFYLIYDKIDDPLLGKKRMNLLWDYFENKASYNLSFRIPVRVKPETKNFSKITKFLKNIGKDEKKACIIELDLYCKLQEICQDDLQSYTVSNKNNGFLHNVIKTDILRGGEDIFIKIQLALTDVKRLGYLNTFEVIVRQKRTDQILISLELDVLAFEFLQKEERPIIYFTSKNLVDLASKGMSYTYVSKPLILSLKSEMLEFELIKSKIDKEDCKFSEVFYFKQLGSQRINSDKKTKCQFLNNFFLE